MDLIATQGTTQRDAAKLAGMNEKALSRALNKPHVDAYLELLKAKAATDAEGLRKVAKGVAIREGLRLMKESGSEQVRARMVEFFAAEPKSGALVQVNVNQQAGGYEYPSWRASGPDTDSPSVAPAGQPVEDAEVVASGCDANPSQPPSEGG